MAIEKVTINAYIPQGYEEIITAATAAAFRAGAGKGRQRHADYDNQPIREQQIARFSQGWRLDQIQKKAAEIPRLRSRDKADEVLDIIVLAAIEWCKLTGAI
jgi:hypothetical protein